MTATPAPSPFFALAAAEPSGDLLGAHLLAALRAAWPGLRSAGIGGERMAQQGFDAWWPVEKLSVRGYLEVLPRLPALLRLRGSLGTRLLAQQPDAFIGIDAPDFNFALEARLKAAGVKTVHFVSPSFWAWRAGKLPRLKAAADLVLCLFPFEPDWLREHGIAATYVGHPLAQHIPMQPDADAARASLGLPARADAVSSGNPPVIALLPGSRSAEIAHLAPRFFRAAALIGQARPGARFLVPAVPHLLERVRALAAVSGLGEAVHVLPGQSHQALAACDVALVASGTATLEAALFKRPMVIAYAMPAFSYWLMRRQRQLPWVGLPNILCAPAQWLRRPPGVAARAHADAADAPFIVPELIQHAATPQALAAATLAWLEDPVRVLATQERFAQLHRDLLRDTPQLACHAIQNLLAR